METEEIIRELASLPPEGRQQVAKFISSLRKRYARSTAGKLTKRLPLKREKFIGMWRDREDLKDSTAWVRSVRKNVWTN